MTDMSDRAQRPHDDVSDPDVAESWLRINPVKFADCDVTHDMGFSFVLA